MWLTVAFAVWLGRFGDAPKMSPPGHARAARCNARSSIQARRLPLRTRCRSTSRCSWPRRPSIVDQEPSPVSHGASIGRLGEEGLSRKFQVPDNTRLPADLKTWTPSHLLPPPGRLDRVM